MPTVADIMTSERLLTVTPDASVGDASRIAIGAHVSHLPVTQGGALVGIVCLCDFEHVHAGSLVSECMNARPITVGPNTPASMTAELMSERDIGCVLVVVERSLRGIVTLRDLHRAGVVDEGPGTCASCGSEDHVRCLRRGGVAGYCLECMRRSLPPGYEIGGG
jgi:predicted transcriptional regulator